MLLLFDFNFGRGLFEFGVDSVELFIGDRDGMCCCFIDIPVVLVEELDADDDGPLINGGEGVIDRDSVNRV